MTQTGKFLSIFTVWRLWISERRLAVDNEFNSATQEILQVEDVNFTWRSKGVLNDTIQRHFIYFSWNCLAEINCWLRILWYDPKKSKGGRCDSYLDIERCLKWHNLENIFFSRHVDIIYPYLKLCWHRRVTNIFFYIIIWFYVP